MLVGFLNNQQELILLYINTLIQVYLSNNEYTEAIA